MIAAGTSRGLGPSSPYNNVIKTSCRRCYSAGAADPASSPELIGASETRDYRRDHRSAPSEQGCDRDCGGGPPQPTLPDSIRDERYTATVRR